MMPLSMSKTSSNAEDNKILGYPKSSFRVVFDASSEVRGSVVYATLIVALVFLPVVF